MAGVGSGEGRVEEAQEMEEPLPERRARRGMAGAAETGVSTSLRFWAWVELTNRNVQGFVSEVI